MPELPPNIANHIAVRQVSKGAGQSYQTINHLHILFSKKLIPGSLNPSPTPTAATRLNRSVMPAYTVKALNTSIISCPSPPHPLPPLRNIHILPNQHIHIPHQITHHRPLKMPRHPPRPPRPSLAPPPVSHRPPLHIHLPSTKTPPNSPEQHKQPYGPPYLCPSPFRRCHPYVLLLHVLTLCAPLTTSSPCCCSAFLPIPPPRRVLVQIHQLPLQAIHQQPRHNKEHQEPWHSQSIPAVS